MSWGHTKDDAEAIKLEGKNYFRGLGALKDHIGARIRAGLAAPWVMLTGKGRWCSLSKSSSGEMTLNHVLGAAPGCGLPLPPALELGGDSSPHPRRQCSVEILGRPRACLGPGVEGG